MALRDQSIDELLSKVQGLQALGPDTQVRSVMAVFARCTLEMSDQVTGLSKEIAETKAKLLDALKDLTSVLGRLQGDIRDATGEAARGSKNLARWTRIQTIAVAVYTVLTGGLLVVAMTSLLRSH